METLKRWFNGIQWDFVVKLIFETIGLLGALCSDKPMQQFGKKNLKKP
jgi:hypothetical protein